MNILQKYSDSNIRLIIVIVSIYCAIISGIPLFKAAVTNKLIMDDTIKNDSLIIINVISNGIGEKAGVKQGDKLIAVNNQEIRTRNEYTEYLNTFEPGTEVIYTIKRNNLILSLPITPYRYFHLLFFVFSMLGYGFLINGFFVGISKPKENTSIIFFILSASASMAFLLYGGVHYYITPFSFLHYNYIIANVFLYPLFFHFFTIFPLKVEMKFRKLKIISIYLYAILINIIAYFDVFEKYYEPYPFIPYLISYLPLVFFLLGLKYFIASYRKISDPKQKKRLKIILYGIIFCFLGLFYYFGVFVPFLSTGNLNYIYRLPVLLILGIPAAFGYSIYKYKILDTEFIVKRSVVFALITAFTVGAYLVLVTIIDNIIASYELRNKQFITIAAIILIVFTFSYINKLAKTFVDKRFYKERYNYRQALLKFSNELPLFGDFNLMFKSLKNLLKETIGTNKLMLWIKNEKYSVINGINFNKTESSILNNLFYSEVPFIELYEQNNLNLSLPDDQMNYLRENNIVLAIPLVINGIMEGALAFGMKGNGKSYNDEDLDLLMTIASQTSVFIENLRLINEEVEKNKIEEELKIARDMQTRLLPGTEFNLENLIVSCASIPARIIGGDFYDIIDIGNGKILFIVADVSGKGIPAALYMAKVQALFRFASGIFKTPREILLEVNKEVYNNFDKSSFVTACLGLFDTINRTVTISRAGHNPALYSDNGEVKILKSKGIGIGLDRHNIFSENLEEKIIELKKESVFLFYTDGLNESMNIHREEYGDDRLKNLFEKHRNKKPNEIKNIIIEEIKRFSGDAEQNDDITLLIVKSY